MRLSLQTLRMLQDLHGGPERASLRPRADGSHGAQERDDLSARCTGWSPRAGCAAGASRSTARRSDVPRAGCTRSTPTGLASADERRSGRSDDRSTDASGRVGDRLTTGGEDHARFGIPDEVLVTGDRRPGGGCAAGRRARRRRSTRRTRARPRAHPAHVDERSSSFRPSSVPATRGVATPISPRLAGRARRRDRLGAAGSVARSIDAVRAGRRRAARRAARCPSIRAAPAASSALDAVALGARVLRRVRAARSGATCRRPTSRCSSDTLPFAIGGGLLMLWTVVGAYGARRGLGQRPQGRRSRDADDRRLRGVACSRSWSPRAAAASSRATVPAGVCVIFAMSRVRPDGAEPRGHRGGR